MAKIVGYKFKVSGHGAFPIDMLRYDCSYPIDSQNLDGIVACHCDREWYDSTRTVSLQSHREPTIARWASFGWVATQVEAIRR